MGRRNPLTDWAQFFGEGYPWRNQAYQIWWRSLKGFRGRCGSNFSISHWLCWSSLQHPHTTVWACDSIWPIKPVPLILNSSSPKHAKLTNWDSPRKQLLKWRQTRIYLMSDGHCQLMTAAYSPCCVGQWHEKQTSETTVQTCPAAKQTDKLLRTVVFSITATICTKILDIYAIKTSNINTAITFINSMKTATQIILSRRTQVFSLYRYWMC